jgi:hypothetical protein
MLSTNLTIKVAELSEYVTQISIKIATGHYQHQSLSLPVLTLIARFMLDA